MTEPDAGERVVAECVERFGRVDVLVNNAGTSRVRGARRADRRGLAGAVGAARDGAAAADAGRGAAHGGGRRGADRERLLVVGQAPVASNAAYSVTKAAQLSLSRVFADAYAVAAGARERGGPGPGRDAAVDRRGRAWPTRWPRRRASPARRRSSRAREQDPARPLRHRGGDRRDDRVPLLRARVERDRRGLVGGRRLGADHPLMRRGGLMGLLFFPRGGSARWSATCRARCRTPAGTSSIACGSLGAKGEQSHAGTFFAGLDVHELDYTASLDADDPVAADPPFHPSYEDRPGAPDRVFASVAEPEYEHQVDAWAAPARPGRRGPGRPAAPAPSDPDQRGGRAGLPGRAARRSHPRHRAGHGPRDRCRSPTRVEVRRTSGRSACGAGPAPASGCSCSRRSPCELVPDVLGVELGACCLVAQRLRARALRADGPGAVTSGRPTGRRWLVEDPQGWDASGEPGSVRYSTEQMAAFAGDSRALIFSGRFTALKRIPLMIAAYTKASARFERRAPLVLLGGFPGEFEGPHPLEVIERDGRPRRLPRRLAPPRPAR